MQGKLLFRKKKLKYKTYQLNFFKNTFMEKSHLKLYFYLNIISSISFKKKSIVIELQYIPLLLLN